MSNNLPVIHGIKSEGMMGDKKIWHMYCTRVLFKESYGTRDRRKVQCLQCRHRMGIDLRMRHKKAAR